MLDNKQIQREEKDQEALLKKATKFYKKLSKAKTATNLIKVIEIMKGNDAQFLRHKFLHIKNRQKLISTLNKNRKNKSFMNKRDKKMIKYLKAAALENNFTKVFRKWKNIKK